MSETVYQMSGWLLATLILLLGYLAWLGIKWVSKRPRPATAGTSTTSSSPAPATGSTTNWRKLWRIARWIVGGIIVLLLIFWMWGMIFGEGETSEGELGPSGRALVSAPAVSAARQAEIEAVRLQVFAPPVSTPYAWAEWEQILEPEHFSTRGSPALESNLYLMQCASSFSKPEGEPGFEVPCDGTRGTPRWFRVRGLDQYGTYITFRFVRFRG